MQALRELTDFVHDSSSVTVLTGAGASTESNIPDYRGARGAYSTGFKPMTHQQFMATPEARSRYWARRSVHVIRSALCTTSATFAVHG